MNKKVYLLLNIFIIITLLSTYSCKKKKPDGTEPPKKSVFEKLTTYMADNNMDLSDIAAGSCYGGWIIIANELHDSLSDYYIIDIRDKDVYDTLGHIPGAVNSSLNNIFTEAANCGGKKIVVVSDDGQLSAFAVSLLRLNGYPSARSLKFGMSSWNPVFDKWSSNVGNVGIGNSNWLITGQAPTPVEVFNYPTIYTNLTDSTAILAERVNTILDDGYKGIKATEVLNNPEQYFIITYWTADFVTLYGFINGTYRMKENLTIETDGFKYLNSSKTIVIYCSTGETSSMVATYLRILGYDAKSMEFGASALIHNQIYIWQGPLNYTYETN